MLELVRRDRPGARVAVWIVVTVAFASVATGVAAIVTEPTIEARGPVATIQSVAEFSGAVVGFALLVTAWGMRRGYRLAYVAAVVLVALSAAHGVSQSRVLSIPLVVLSTGGLVVLVLTSPRFTRSVSWSETQFGALFATVGVLCYGTAGAYALRGEFDGVHTPIDALYFTLVTAGTVGYGDVHPVGEGARLFATSLVLLGPITAAVAAGSLVGPALEKRLTGTGKRIVDRGRPNVDRSLVVLGCDEVTVPVLAAAVDRATLFVVTDDERRAARLEDCDVDVRRGEPTDETTLQELDLDRREAVVVATADEARTLRAVLATRAVDPDVRVVALATAGSVDALERAGADVVIDPLELIGTAAVDAAFDADGQSAASASAHRG